MDAELPRRVLSAAILIPAVAAAVLWAPPDLFAFVVGLFVLAGTWEWAGLSGWRRRSAIGYVLGSAVLLVGAYFALRHDWAVNLILVGGLAWWCVALVWVVGYQRGRGPSAMRLTGVQAAGGWFILVPAWVGLVTLHREGADGPYWVLFLLTSIWIADVAAYFVGRAWGHRRLAPRVSPGKSWEGVGGALVAVVAYAITIDASTGMVRSATAVFVIICAATAVVSILGDLAESMFKRRVGVKDSGVLIPGHGGVLDRIDSLTAAVPCFAIGVKLLGVAA